MHKVSQKIKLPIQENNVIGILPFISFKNPLMEFGDFIIFSDYKIDDIENLSENFKKSLKIYSSNQKDFHQNPNGYISFIISKNNASKETFNDFIKTLFFYLHKWKIVNFLSSPNVFCKEDFKHVLLECSDESNGTFIAKTKFKFKIDNKFENFIIHTIGCENISKPEQEEHNFKYRDIELDPTIFLNFWNDIKDQIDTQRAINFYIKAMSCELNDDERFVWLSSSLEAFFAIGKDNNKSEKIKNEVCNLVRNKNFQIFDQTEIIERLSNLITVIYDYRSSYVHEGWRSTKSKDLEKQLIKYFGKIDFVIALMNLVSILLVNKQIEDRKFESIMNVIFYNQEIFDEIIKIFKDGADTAKENMKNNYALINIMRFSITDVQLIQFRLKQVNKCMDNILHILAKYSRDNMENQYAIKIQEKIETIELTDTEKYKKWNDFFIRENNFIDLPIEIQYSISVFTKMFELLKYEMTIY